MRILVEPRTKLVLFALWCLAWLVVLVASLRPIQELPLGMSDKLLHFLCYAGMTAAVAGFCHEVHGVLRWAVVGIVLGGLVEVAQGRRPPRSMDLGDFLMDGAGVATGALVAIAWLIVVVRPLRRMPA